MRKAKIIINPIAGTRSKDVLPRIIEKELDTQLFDYELIYSAYRGHARDIATASLNDNTEVIIIVGGDGSINEVSEPLRNTEIILGIIPGGSGNGISRHLKIPLNFKKAIEVINAGKTTVIDTGVINDHHFVGFCGLGYDAHIAYKFNETGKRGFKNYVKLVLQELKRFVKLNVVVKNRNNLTKNDLYLCSFMNVSQFGNNFKISKHAKHNDGELDMVFVQKPWLIPMLRLFYLGFFGNIHNSKYVEMHRGNEFILNKASDIAHVDGDPIILEDDEIKVRNIPQSLTILVP